MFSVADAERPWDHRGQGRETQLSSLCSFCLSVTLAVYFPGNHLLLSTKGHGLDLSVNEELHACTCACIHLLFGFRLVSLEIKEQKLVCFSSCLQGDLEKALIWTAMVMQTF